MAELVFKKPIPNRPLTPEFAADPDFVEVKLLAKAKPGGRPTTTPSRPIAPTHHILPAPPSP